MTTPTPISPHRPSRPALKPALLLAAVLGLGALNGCAPLVIGGMVGSSMVASDRRTSGTQLEDQSIEIKALSRIKDIMGEREAPSATSYNRVVLLLGVVPSQSEKIKIEQAIMRIPNVRSVVNEISTQGISISSSINDAVLTSKVKATFFDAKDLHVSAFKVVTQNSVVYLMGRVTEREAKRATDLARGIVGVKKVVKVFEIVSEAELVEMTPGRPPGTVTTQ